MPQPHLSIDQRQRRGPFDIIGDVHGCYEELVRLLTMLGWQVNTYQHQATPPAGRSAIFLGDLTDRGPDSVSVLKLVMNLTDQGTALCVMGNHDVKLMRALQKHPVQMAPTLAETIAQIDQQPGEFREQVQRWLEGMPVHHLLDGGALVVAHAGLKEDLHGRDTGASRAFCLFGDTTGEKDEYGLPVRRDWAQAYHGRALIVYGHTPVARPRWVHNTVNIDTGCAFGGSLTALRYPEREFMSIPAQRMYADSKKPFLPAPVLQPPDSAAE